MLLRDGGRKMGVIHFEFVTPRATIPCCVQTSREAEAGEYAPQWEM